MGCLGHQEDLNLKVAGSHHRQVLSHACPETTQPWVEMGAGTVFAVIGGHGSEVASDGRDIQAPWR